MSVDETKKFQSDSFSHHRKPKSAIEESDEEDLDKIQSASNSPAFTGDKKLFKPSQLDVFTTKNVADLQKLVCQLRIEQENNNRKLEAYKKKNKLAEEFIKERAKEIFEDGIKEGLEEALKHKKKLKEIKHKGESKPPTQIIPKVLIATQMARLNT
ncbi:hypothetical protein M569_16041 [Genlisea aurea]|uniref:Uncharacterized protein n=1 Tax=Genlisea aurea TaxID=192259 RepID=S8DHA7_9LAMI|nr:hypothetical protein M569_16041 [Genlisea aurea]